MRDPQNMTAPSLMTLDELLEAASEATATIGYLAAGFARDPREIGMAGAIMQELRKRLEAAVTAMNGDRG